MILNYVLIVFIVLLFFIICYKIFDIAGYNGGSDNKKYKYTFPHYKKFKSVKETYYSIAGPYQTAQEIKIFKSLFETVPKEIIDATAHVGVDSLTLAYTFPSANITSVERNPVVYELLKENIENLGYSKHRNGGTRFTVVNMSADVYLNDLDHTVDLIYMDPPWGGRGYVETADLPLHDESGNPTIPLSGVINIALRKTKLLVLKAPYNFKVDEFGTKINGKIDRVCNIKRLNDPSRASFIFIIIRS